jgi:hypothetical protein
MLFCAVIVYMFFTYLCFPVLFSYRWKRVEVVVVIIEAIVVTAVVEVSAVVEL